MNERGMGVPPDDTPDCKPDETGQLYFNLPNTTAENAQEVVGYQAEIACLLGTNCGGDPVCEAWVLALAIDRCGEINGKGGSCDPANITYH